jgi:hypothetical protein
MLLLFHLEISRLVHAESERNQTKSTTKRVERVVGKEEEEEEEEASPFPSSRESAVKRRLILFCGEWQRALRAVLRRIQTLNVFKRDFFTGNEKRDGWRRSARRKSQREREREREE